MLALALQLSYNDRRLSALEGRYDWIIVITTRRKTKTRAWLLGGGWDSWGCSYWRAASLGARRVKPDIIVGNSMGSIVRQPLLRRCPTDKIEKVGD